MKNVLLDENLPKKLRGLLVGFNAITVVQAGWSGKKNGELLKLANEKFDVLLTVDKGIKYQNNFTGLKISVVQIFVRSNSIIHILPILDKILLALHDVSPGEIIQVKS